MMFATVETKDKSETDVLAQKWSGLLSTGGVQVKVITPFPPVEQTFFSLSESNHQAYVVEADSILFTEEDGKRMDIQEFVLEQPETLSFRVDNQDVYPPGAHASLVSSRF